MSQLSQLDANQVVKTVYDPSTQSLKTVSGSVANTVLLSAVAASASITSTPVNILGFSTVGIVVSWAGLNTTDSTIQFQGSVDGNPAHYDNIGSATTLSTASGHQSYSLVDEPYQFFQIVYTHGTNSAGTITASYILRA
jgi:uncharacterized protein YfaQ (DUF2300 family)